ncbi:MAG TPA: hypothetical protein VGT05_00135 [Patescibacteria group bacterium]|nr:hypothetical protein [Patescibacteria group bacterium]
MIVISVLLFILFFLVAIYIPGRYLFDLLYDKQFDGLIREICAFGLGISFFLVTVYILSWIHVTFLYYFFLLFCLIQEVSRLLTKQKITWDKNVFVILIGSFAAVLFTITSGIITKRGMQLYGANAIDGFFHVSLIRQFIAQFPPKTPYLSDVPFHGYHFLYDFLIANFFNLFPVFSVYDLFFRFFPVFLMLFFGFSALATAKYMKMSKAGILIFLILLYFGQGLTAITSFLLDREFLNYNPGIIQGYSHIFDPTVLFGTCFVFLLVPTFFSVKTKKEMLFPILLLGVLPSTKIYAAVMVYVAVFVVSGISFLRERNTRFLFMCLFGFLLGAFLYLPINYGAGGLLFAPFLLYRHFIEGSLALSSYAWGLKYQVFAAHNNQLHIAFLYLVAVFWYFVPSLNIRFLSLLRIQNLFRKSFYQNYVHVFWLIVILVGLLLPTFFVQISGVFNVFQFIWLTYIFLLIPTGFVIGSIYVKKQVVSQILLVSLIFIVIVPDLFVFFRSFFASQPFIVPLQTLAMSEVIQREIPVTDAIIVLDQSGNSFPVFSALTGRQIYYETPSLDNNATASIRRKRLANMGNINMLLHNCSLTGTELNKLIGDPNVHYALLLQQSHCFPGMLLGTRGQEMLFKL